MGKAATNAIQNRELSWLQFNRRVQMEADQPKNPLLERAKFLAIVTSNLDEFFQVRYFGVYKKATGKKAEEKQLGGLTARNLYRKVNKEILSQNNMQYTLFEGICSEMYLHGIRLYPVFPLSEKQIAREKELFEGSIAPYLKVVSEDAVIAQKQLHLCVKLEKNHGKKGRFALVALPTTLPRVYDISVDDEDQCLICLEDIVKHHVQQLFPKETVEHCAAFRILRNQDFDLPEGEDMEEMIREMLAERVTGQVMRLEAEERMSEEMLSWLMKGFRVDYDRRYRVTGPLDLNKLMMALYGIIKRPELKFAPKSQKLLDELMGDDIFEKIEKKDYLLYHPYHSFEPVVHLLEKAAEDPQVKAVSQTLYRVSGNSPIVAALAKAASNGKKVFVLFESQARFDEENNLFWGERLRRAGCEVHYGFPNLKCHSKITLIEREVEGEIKRTLHLGTGNYHDSTAKLYTDFGLLTADEQLGEDGAAFFEILRGNENATLQEIKKAPDMLQTTVLQLIEREKENAEAGKPASIIAKMNSMCDEPVMEALCAAGRAGVRVDLMIRGICCLIPGVEGVSDNVHVYSIVGRHLEHARAFVFENGGDHEVYLSSADWMPRNLYKRVELLFPVKDEACKKAVENVLRLQLHDNEKCRVRLPNGAYTIQESEGASINAQELLLNDVEAVFRGDVTPETLEAAYAEALPPVEEPAPAEPQADLAEEKKPAKAKTTRKPRTAGKSTTAKKTAGKKPVASKGRSAAGRKPAAQGRKSAARTKKAEENSK
ncbi:MAG: polyphosphate kinase 1 [Clostridia bacterium]|nr:polyphosphate kinase 1 [Clostridia bacterium]